ncbi:cytochrome c oxidase accessory protein CcoG [Jannaschia pagri]|uniref:Cytochrome c oxidase accessory protein CcoG n=1 Tax=Jannaschia pagri TaxID=2829797 RepID=A0ABQ4NK90_9RHOB|nr:MULTISPECIES: cytochrome c oxidase accessory protein CcoG [unclassified Jannaschia]GIT90818.1 cytochrome c oxidase accessory protein CcoG [Jannaschia sp. AI_61]GIT94650.1 cytochrome c oxidase accessory protein CcoG [Jannaschia sp. AI_62]
MTDTPPLFAAREPIFPRRVSGTFRRLKWWIMALTLGIYYLIPWIRWDRGPNLPDQAVLVDLAGRRFYFFWIEIWPHEFYFVAGLLIMAGLGLFLFTSALGRVWCGYTCPQTVWTDLFILVERWIEGDRNARVRLWKAKWDARKIRLRITKYAAWAVIGLATGGAWVFYFADAPSLARDLLSGSAHPVAYTTIAILTFTTILLGGIAREQVCIYMCPWPRIQGAMVDDGTLTVGYRDWRGEPRGKKHENQTGDCIDCMACVNVCPMGIDIRDGQQMACITCALCIDACDDVMDKIGKPRGLIDYLALSDRPPEVPSGAAAAQPLVADGGVMALAASDVASAQGVYGGLTAGAPANATPPTWQPQPAWRHIFRRRTLVYTTLWALVGVGLVVALFIRPEIDMTVAPVRNPQFVTLSDGTIRNAYDIRLRNKHGEPRDFHLSLRADETLRIALEGRDNLVVPVPADSTLLQRVYVSARPQDAAAGTDRTDLRFWVEDIVSAERAHSDTLFFGKEAAQ